MSIVGAVSPGGWKFSDAARTELQDALWCMSEFVSCYKVNYETDVDDEERQTTESEKWNGTQSSKPEILDGRAMPHHNVQPSQYIPNIMVRWSRTAMPPRPQSRLIII